ncbi:MAG TPA: zinc-binding dehydrogenase [Thermomicrobiales bacterium]|nr:zinc-binding dehydrogenase [Thermomicrobiales bacterium]
MRALEYQFSLPNYVAVRAADRLPLQLIERGTIPGLREIAPEQKPLPGPEWTRIAPILTGICGSDISTILNRSSAALMPFTSFPLTPGHEIVGRVTEVGARTSGISAGQRVVVMPLISCQMRGVEPCEPCARGEPGVCTKTTEGDFSAGMLIGFCRDLPGGWSQEMIAHQSQIYAIPDEIPDRAAVLIEPFSVAIHAVLRDPPPDDAKVLIVGSGTIGLLVLAALRLLGKQCDVTVLARHPKQVELAEKFGATRVLRRKSAGEAAQEVTGARRFKLIKGGHTYAGGFDWVFDCVGSKTSVDEGLRVAGPHGHIVMVGCASEVPKLDLSYLWARELTVTGCYVYGREKSLPGEPHSFEVAIDLLAKCPDFGLDQMVTHTIPLSNWRTGFQTVLDRKGSGAIKVVYDCQA